MQIVGLTPRHLSRHQLLVMCCRLVEETISLVLLYSNSLWSIEKGLRPFKKLAFFTFISNYIRWIDVFMQVRFNWFETNAVGHLAKSKNPKICLRKQKNLFQNITFENAIVFLWKLYFLSRGRHSDLKWSLLTFKLALEESTFILDVVLTS